MIRLHWPSQRCQFRSPFHNSVSCRSKSSDEVAAKPEITRQLQSGKGARSFIYMAYPGLFSALFIAELFTTLITKDVWRSLDISTPCWQGMSSLPGLTLQQEGVLKKPEVKNRPGWSVFWNNLWPTFLNEKTLSVFFFFLNYWFQLSRIDCN